MERRSSVWYLTGRVSQNESIQEVAVDATPFRVGRKADLSLTLPYAAVSNVHAELIVEPRSLSVRDLNSTNGTFVNGVRVSGETPLQPGDQIQFADIALRVQQRDAEPEHADEPEWSPIEAEVPSSRFENFLMTRSVIPHYQPIVSLRDQQLVGNEVLARSRFEGLRTPAEMFVAACQRNLEEELSRMLRMASLEQCMVPGQSPNLFLNTHPSRDRFVGTVAFVTLPSRSESAHADDVRDSRTRFCRYGTAKTVARGNG